MDELIKSITGYSGIIQGVIGSAIFAIIVFFGQKLLNKIMDILSKYSKDIKRKKLTGLRRKYHGIKARNNNEFVKSNSVQISLIYSSMRDIIKGLLWILLGLLFANTLFIFETIGYIGGIYYMFSALSIVQGIEIPQNIDEEIKRINKELNKL